MKSLVLAGAFALGLATFQAPLGLLAASHAKPPKPDDIFKNLHDATARAKMKGGLRGTLLPLLDAARRDWKAGRDQSAGEKLLQYVAKLSEQKGNEVAPQVADALIEAANDAIDELFPYPFAADYDRVSVLGSLSPRDIDWRDKGSVTPVKNQGASCRSDYAFSATGAMEGAHAASAGTLIAMSAQQIIDCDQESFGCDGGSPVRALEYVIGLQPSGGIATEASYPYTGGVGTCKANAANAVAQFTAISRPAPGDEVALAHAVDMSPVSVILRIRTSAWDSYTTGILDEPALREGLPRYVTALVVGYVNFPSHWIVKTSNGTSFGSNGYVQVSRGTNAFGIANFAVVPED